MSCDFFPISSTFQMIFFGVTQCMVQFLNTVGSMLQRHATWLPNKWMLSLVSNTVISSFPSVFLILSTLPERRILDFNILNQNCSKIYKFRLGIHSTFSTSKSVYFSGALVFQSNSCHCISLTVWLFSSKLTRLPLMNSDGLIKYEYRATLLYFRWG